jgi:hypothetical protein
MLFFILKGLSEGLYNCKRSASPSVKSTSDRKNLNFLFFFTVTICALLDSVRRRCTVFMSFGRKCHNAVLWIRNGFNADPDPAF